MSSGDLLGPSAELYTSWERQDGVGVLTLSGRFAAESVPEFTARARLAIDSGQALVVADLIDLEEVSAAGAGALIELVQELYGAGKTVSVLQPREATGFRFVAEALRLLETPLLSLNDLEA